MTRTRATQKPPTVLAMVITILYSLLNELSGLLAAVLMCMWNEPNKINREKVIGGGESVRKMQK